MYCSGSLLFNSVYCSGSLLFNSLFQHWGHEIIITQFKNSNPILISTSNKQELVLFPLIKKVSPFLIHFSWHLMMDPSVKNWCITDNLLMCSSPDWIQIIHVTECFEQLVIYSTATCNTMARFCDTISSSRMSAIMQHVARHALLIVIVFGCYGGMANVQTDEHLGKPEELEGWCCQWCDTDVWIIILWVVLLFSMGLSVIGWDGGTHHWFDGPNSNTFKKFEGSIMKIKYASFHRRY